MKWEQITTWLYFGKLYCTGALLAFNGWLCGTELISQVVMPRSEYERRKFLGIQL